MKNLILFIAVLFFVSCTKENSLTDENVTASEKSASLSVFPGLIHLPDGFQPEGIAIGSSHEFYVGSLVTGQIYKGDVQTGEGEIFIVPPEPIQAVGLDIDDKNRYLFVANGAMGSGSVFNIKTGEFIRTIAFLPPGTSFINDVVATKDAVYFTNSAEPVLFKVPFDKSGSLTDPVQVITLDLTGDFSLIPNPEVPTLGFFSNGIDATPNGKYLILANTDPGELYRVDPETGESTLIDLGGPLPFPDGILLDGKTLYVVQNMLNQVAVIHLNNELNSGTLTNTITNPDFGVPTTVAEFGNRLYVVNAHFDIAPPGGVFPDVEFEVVVVEK